MNLKALALATLFAAPTLAHAEIIYGLENNAGATQRLVTFDSAGRSVLSSVTLGIPSAIGSISSIDFRPATGQLYGYARAARQLYTIDVTSGALTPVGAPGVQGSTDPSTGGSIDFNPTADAIRLTGDLNALTPAATNFRINATTGVRTQDGNLAYSAGDPNFGASPDIVATAYVNNVAAAASTRLYDIDRVRDVLVSQDPANSGMLQTIGPVGFDVGAGTFGSFTGFDVSGRTGIAYVSSSDANSPFGAAAATTSTLYSINLGTGAAQSLGGISGLTFGRSLADITVAPTNILVPEPASLAAIAVVGALAVVRRRRAR